MLRRWLGTKDPSQHRGILSLHSSGARLLQAVLQQGCSKHLEGGGCEPGFLPPRLMQQLLESAAPQRQQVLVTPMYPGMFC